MGKQCYNVVVKVCKASDFAPGAFFVWRNNMIEKLLKRFFDYDIIGTWLVKDKHGYWKTHHIKKYRLKKFWK